MDAWWYARKSPSDTDEQIGVDGQKRLCIGEIERRGWTAAGGFEDVAKSAYEAQHRPGYEALVEAIRVGRVGAVVVRHNDRLHRDVSEYQAFVKLIRKHRVQVVAVLGGDWEVETAQGRYTGTMLAGFSAFESQIKSERVNAALLRRAEAGLPANTRFRPFGFEEDGIRHRPAEVRFLRKAAADLLADRRSLGEVARDAGKTVTGMRKILLGLRLVGAREFQGREYPAKWKPVLDRETWDALGVALRGRALEAPRARRWLLTGLLTCGSCGKRLAARETRGKDVYGCLTAATNPCPRKVQRQADRLEAYVVEAVLAELTERGRTPMAAAAEVEAALADTRAYEKRLTEIEAELEEDGAPIAALSRAYQGVERKLAAARSRVTVAPVRGAWGGREIEVAGELWEPYQDAWEVWWQQREGESEAELLERRRHLLASELTNITVLPTAHGRLPLDSNNIKLEWRPSPVS